MTADLSTNHRRKPVCLPAWIEDDGAVIPCVISGISQDHAELRIHPKFEVGTLFPLRLTRDGRLRRACRMIRRDGATAAVEFIRARF